MTIRSICVFCGSSPGRNSAYVTRARQLGQLLASRGLTVVYGGGGPSIGLMGAMAEGALQEGGEVIGVIPGPLATRERAHHGLTELHVVNSMHERKAMMAELADAFFALPGGMGTLEEFCEIVTWAQLGIHHKPVALLDVDAYFKPLTAFFDHMVREGFLRPEYRELIMVDDDPAALLDRFAAFASPIEHTWLQPEQT